ncbi:aromatic ring-hydroxylating oxygenase subunit alpha [Bradyrhizobium zhanjiangense]|uniref:Aromatic ring-hydroxylating dioxygenase subunit alpha n=1 Tax=Bradyrhizobium zhanjiangense TaxID=1325107 RepID=A0A4Q0Q5J6_9BRAD|nr:aromatic ring-hydroxylating dioxygenase subunit alpha [Bradyrhizobium zhanjiangense]RXG83873.1 aromatic ring-hydroxylating dioxygenase subunit alpha [Bradyrhizobium zhanjiangense]
MSQASNSITKKTREAGDAADEYYIGLRRLEKTLPKWTYFDPAQYDRELKAIWYKEWNYVCRAEAIEKGSFRRHAIGDQDVLIVRDEQGNLRAFHNTCRHRGSRLCAAEEGSLSNGNIVCPYHAWTYALDGKLLGVPGLSLPPDFEKGAFSLFPVAVTVWRGFVFINFDSAAVPNFEPFGARVATLASWPLEELKLAHSYSVNVACNWKIFWENSSECYHCPGVHPELSKMAPIVGRGIMELRQDPNWQENQHKQHPRFQGGIAEGMKTYSLDGQTKGEPFPGLTEEDHRTGFGFRTNWPSVLFGANVDFVRALRVRPLGPEQTEISLEFFFSEENLANPEFDPKHNIEFTRRVVDQDISICELNQAGLRSMAFESGVLMPSENYVHAFQEWVCSRLG